MFCHTVTITSPFYDSNLNRGGSSRFSDRCINRKCEVTIGTVGATERRRLEHLGGSGGMLSQENFEI